MPGFSSPRLEIGKVLFDGRNKIYEVVNTSKKGQKVDESMVVKECPLCAPSMNEIQFLSELKHKNIIRYRGYERQHKSHCSGGSGSGTNCEEKVNIFLEKAHGGDVYEQLNRFGRFPEEVARSLFVQMVEAVRFLHSHNIAHRDLKVENFLLMEKSGEQVEQLSKCHIKLADFEFACAKTASQPRRQDRAGTDEYLSPEQIQGDYCPFKADIWALGTALYLMVCGRYPQFSAARQLEMPETISFELGALLRSILESDEFSRPTIEEVRKHNWTTGHVAHIHCHVHNHSPRHSHNILFHKSESNEKCGNRTVNWPHFHLTTPWVH